MDIVLATRHLLWRAHNDGLTAAELRAELVFLGYLAPGGCQPLTRLFLSAGAKRLPRERRSHRKGAKQPVWIHPFMPPESIRRRIPITFGISPP